jgi:putative flavoprotein involved in K+ transport
MRLLSPCLPQRDWTSISPDYPIWKLPVKRPYCSAKEFVNYLETARDQLHLNIEEYTEVERVLHDGDTFQVVAHSGKKWQANNLVVATGIMNGLNFPDVPGIEGNPVVSHSHQFTGEKEFRNQRVLILGGGNSAAEIAIELAGKAMVYLYSRHEIRYFSETDRLYHVRGISESYLKELIRMEIIRHKPNIKLKEVKGNRLIFEDSELVVDKIIFATGYKPVFPFLDELKIERTGKGYPKTDQLGQSIHHPGLFFAGPLAKINMTSALIHGFSRQVEPTMRYIAAQINKHGVISDSEVQQNPINIIS